MTLYLTIKTLHILSATILFGTDRSAFHMEMRGIGHDGQRKSVTFYILTASGHGLNIPTIPSIILALRLARGEITQRGVRKWRYAAKEDKGKRDGARIIHFARRVIIGMTTEGEA